MCVISPDEELVVVTPTDRPTSNQLASSFEPDRKRRRVHKQAANDRKRTTGKCQVMLVAVLAVVQVRREHGLSWGKLKGRIEDDEWISVASAPAPDKQE